MSERIVKLENQELKELILELKAIDTNIAKMVKDSEEAQEKFNSEIAIRQKIVDKMKPIVNAEFVGQLGEFEVLANVILPEVEEGNFVEVKIIDEVERFKEEKRKAKETEFAPAQEVSTV